MVETDMRGQDLGSFSAVAAFGALGVALAMLAMSVGVAPNRTHLLRIIHPVEVEAAVALAACALTLLLFLRERPRLAALAAAIVLGLGVLTAQDRSALVTASGLLAYGGRDLAGPQIVFGLVCLALGLGARGTPRDIGVALVVALATACAAQALAAMMRGALPGAIGAVPSGAMVPGAMGLLLLALGLFGHAVRSADGLIDRPIVWLPMLLALAIMVADLLAPRTGELRFGYALVVACGACVAQRAITRLFVRVSIGLAVFGCAVSWHGATSRATELALLGVAIGVILLAGQLVDRLQRAEAAHARITRQRDALLQLTHSACIDLDLASMTVSSVVGVDPAQGRAAAPLAWEDFVATRIAPEQQAVVAASLAAARTAAPSAADAIEPHPENDACDAIDLCWLPAEDDRGLPTRLTGLLHDRSHYNRNDRDRVDLRARLRNAQKLESLALLSGGVAHDLNNTLVPVSILAPLLFDSIVDPADRRSVELIIDAAQRARDLARDMLAYARDDRPAFETIRLAELVRGALPLLRARIPAHITIRDAVVPVPEIAGNQRQLYQVILNLTVNAAEAIGARAGTITIGTMIADAGGTGTASVGLFVADDGAGMDPALLDHAFEPFFSTKPNDEATGIGLAIVRRIVQLHGGSVAVDSSPGAGTRFDLFFPERLVTHGRPSPGDAAAPCEDPGERIYAEATLYRR